MKTPADKEISFVFVSHPLKEVWARWTATIIFPAGSGPETLLRVEVVNGEGVPVSCGFFEVAGQKIKIEAGHGVMRYCDFVAGRHEPSLWLHREGMRPVPGGLTFG